MRTQQEPHPRRSAQARPIFDTLTDKFWPGPLTLVLKARPDVPLKVSAGTGFVGVRSPAHAVAAALLEAAQLPIAAPSANRFGHVSPTTAAHVLADLGATPIAVLDAEGQTSAAAAAGGSPGPATCSVGIESTVVGVSEDGKTLTVFRRGGVSMQAIEEALAGAGVTGWAWQQSSAAAKSATAAAASEQDSHDDASAQVAPGQLLTHYAPDVSTYLLPAPPLGGAGDGLTDVQAAALKRCVVLDFGGAYAVLKGHAGAYRDMSSSGDVKEAAQGLYAALRWTEEVAAADADICLALVPVDAVAVDGDATAGVKAGGEMAGALADRLYRSGSGRRVPATESTVASVADALSGILGS